MLNRHSPSRSFDFAPRPRILGWVVLAVGALLCGWALNAGLEAASEGARLREKTLAGTDKATQQESHAAKEAIAQLQPELQSARRVIARLDLDWAALLAAVEAQKNHNVAMLTLEPSAASRTLTLTAEAADPDAATRFVATLASHGQFSNVHLVQHQALAMEPGRPLRFSLSAKWNLDAVQVPPSGAVVPR